MNSVLISIKPEYTKPIEKQEKNYEFRNYLIKDLKYMVVYESETSVIKYVMEVDIPVKYPDKIEGEKCGNIDFNNGLLYNYAYHIKHLYKLEKPIKLIELKSKYNVFAPQKYVYLDKYAELEKRLKQEKYIKIY